MTHLSKLETEALQGGFAIAIGIGLLALTIGAYNHADEIAEGMIAAYEDRCS